MFPSTRAGWSWDRLTCILRRAPHAWIHGGILILYCSVLVLAPGYAAPPSAFEQAEQLTDEALRLSRAGRYQEAIPLAEDALRWRKVALGPAHPHVAASLNYLGSLYQAQGQYAQAEPLHHRALAILEEALGPTHPAVATSLNRLALLYFHQGQYAQAEPLVRRALAIVEQTLGPGHPDVAANLNSLAVIYRHQGQYAQAEPLVRRALAIREQALGPGHPDVATSLNNLAELSQAQGQYARAEPLHYRALAIREQALGPGHPDVAMSLNNLAFLYRHQGQYARAEPLYRRALAIVEQALGPTHPHVATTLNNLAGLSQAQGQYAQAEPLVRRVLAILEQALGPTHPHVAATLNNLAELYRHQGQYAQAEPLYRRALAIVEQALGPEHPDVATSLNNLALLYSHQGQYARAEPLHRRTLAIWEQTLGPTHPHVALSLGNLAAVLAQQHQLAVARPLFERARQIALAVRHANIDLDEETHRHVLRQHTESLHAYADLLATLARAPAVDPHAPPAALDAFLVAEQVRWGAVQLALARAGARAAVQDAVTATLARQVQDLQYRQRAVWTQLTDAYRTPMAAWDAGRIRHLQQTAQQLDRERADATARLHQTFPRYAALAAPAPIDMPAVQALLHRDEALISWLTLPDRVLVWLVRPGQAPVYRDLAITKASLTTMVARVRSSLEQGPWRPFDVATAHALYALLLAPLQEHLAGVTHLLLVPDDVLLPLPFGVLMTDATGEPYQRLAGLVTQPRRPSATDFTAYAQLAWLVKDYTLTMLPSATALQTLRQTPRGQGAPREPLLGFGDPVLRGEGERRGGAPMLAGRGAQVPLEVLRGLPRLPETRAELLAVATTLGADPRRALYLGDRATKPMVQELNTSGRLGQAQVLAFATHGLLTGELTGLTQPALVLTPPATPSDWDDGLLALEDILGLNLPQTSWVILSACNTAADDGSGEGLSGLARAFFFAGAQSLLVSHWSVDDAATRVLMTEVFRRQPELPGLLRAEALRQGMLAVMTRTQGKTATFTFAHPYAWAPFVLVGEGGRGKP